MKKVGSFKVQGSFISHYLRKVNIERNINFLRYNEHTNTEDYLNILYSNNFLPLITRVQHVKIVLLQLIKYSTAY